MLASVFAPESGFLENPDNILNSLGQYHQEYLKQSLLRGGWKELDNVRIIRRAKTGRQREQRLQQRRKRADIQEKAMNCATLQKIVLQPSKEIHQKDIPMKKALATLQKMQMQEKNTHEREKSEEKADDMKSESQSQVTMKINMTSNEVLDIEAINKCREKLKGYIWSELENLKDISGTGKVEISAIETHFKNVLKLFEKLKEQEDCSK